MRVPLSWLTEYVGLPAGTTPEEVHAALVKVGLEEEDIHRFDVSGPVVVGQVLEFTEEPQSNGKTIRWCQVEVGEAAPRGIVCGAQNFFAGDKVVVTLPGSVLPGPFPIAARRTYGHVSDGMIASARELGLGEEHSGILRLSELGLDPEVGTDALALLGLDDAAVEVNVTPDRGYAFSIRGIAREYSHSTGAVFRDPADGVPGADQAHSGFPVAISDGAPIRGRAGASVFITRVVRGVDPSRPTPPWLVSRLLLAGIRSISLIVDITNYVMLELGQPIHAYDLDKLSGGITVRRAEAGEKLRTLDDKVRELDPEDLLITDDSGPIGLAGVMGGASTEVGAGTANVLIEAANFDPVSIARTARRHKLPSEASKRFERGVDPQVAAAAGARVVQLLEQLAGGRADPLGSVYDEAVPAQPILLPAPYVSTLLGFDVAPEEVHDSLTAIGAQVAVVDGAFSVTAPSWRPDLVGRPDLAEEVARIVGYDRIPSALPVAPPGRGLTRPQQLRRAAAQALAAGGLTEVLAYPFVTEQANTTFGAPDDTDVPAVRLANPLDGAAPYLRTSLLPGLLEVAKRNLSRGFTDLALFEIGLVFRPVKGSKHGSVEIPPGGERPADAVLQELNAGIPPQPRHVGALFLGNVIDRQPGQGAVAAGLPDALDTARQLGLALGVPIAFEQGRHKALHPGRTARVVVPTASGRVPVGYAGELLPALADEHDLPRVVAVLELDLDELIRLAGVPATIAIATLPAATQDLSLVVPREVPAGDVLAAVRDGAGELLEDIRLTDDYRGSGVDAAHKSLTFALRFRAADRTLTAAEASDAKLAGAARAAELFSATPRE